MIMIYIYVGTYVICRELSVPDSHSSLFDIFFSNFKHTVHNINIGKYSKTVRIHFLPLHCLH